MEASRPDPLTVFISYRRADSAGHAGRIHDALRRQFGKDHVFFDVTAIEGGMDFALAIREAIGRSAVVVVVVGPRWGRRPFIDRLLARPDWARFEVEHARRLGKPVVPVLVAGAGVPGSLPASLQFLSTIHAIALRDDSWESDVERLLARLPQAARAPIAPSEPTAAPRFRAALAAAAFAVMLLALWLGPRLWRSPPAAVDGQPGAHGASPSPAATSQSAAPGNGAPNRPPTDGKIDVNVFNNIGIVSATKFTLTATGITDPDGDDIRYRWDFGDGSPSPASSPRVTKVYERVRSYDVVLYVKDGRMAEDRAAAQTRVTVRSLTGTWRLSLQPDPKASYRVPQDYTVELVQEGDQLSGRITPLGVANARSTVLTGQVKDPMDVSFGSESAWWNDSSDAYFDLAVSDGALMIQLSNRTPGRCSWQVPCLGARMTKQ